MQPLSNLYQDILLDHYRHPRNRGRISNPHAYAELRNPLCGDRVELTLTFDAEGRVNDARFTGEGCSIAKASSSMLTEAIRGCTRSDARELHRRVMALLAPKEGANGSGDANRDLGDVRALAGVAPFRGRIRCARMPWDALMQAIGGNHS